MRVELKPHPNMVKLYYCYLVVGIVAGILSWALPVGLAIYFFEPAFFPIYLLIVAVPTVLTVALAAIWIPLYHRSLEYRIDEDTVYAKRGVWWVRESRIPISRVNDVVLSQGPLQRIFGLASLGFHTAAIGMPAPEVQFINISVEDAERIRNMTLELIRREKPRVERKEKTVEELMLEELRTIRELLEKLLKA